MEGHQVSSYLQRHHQYGAAANIDAAAGGGGVGDRFSQWSIQETRDMLVVRAELEPAFVDAKRPNKLLWEVIATKMKEKGYNRTAEQCKSKWKNLVVRYKGCETMEQEGMRQQFPFYDDLRAIFAARMDRMLSMEAEGGGASSKKRATGAALSSDDDEENDNSDGEVKGGGGRKIKKRKAAKGNNSESTGNLASSLKEILEEFTKQQREMEMQWKRAYEEREEERRVKEMEWRKVMEALENERLMMERRWREREEQRRVREEARAETRDALINALLNKLRRDDSM